MFMLSILGNHQFLISVNNIYLVIDRVEKAVYYETKNLCLYYLLTKWIHSKII